MAATAGGVAVGSAVVSLACGFGFRNHRQTFSPLHRDMLWVIRLLEL